MESSPVTWNLSHHLFQGHAYLVCPAFRGIVNHASYAHVAVGKAGSRDVFQQLDKFLPCGETPDEIRGSPGIDTNGPQRQEVAGHSIDLRHDHAQVLGALRDFYVHELLGCTAVHPVVEHGGNVVHCAIRERDYLVVVLFSASFSKERCMYPIRGSTATTSSPSSFATKRSAPGVAGCGGPMLVSKS